MHFGGHGSLPVELFKVKNTSKQRKFRKFLKVTTKPETLEKLEKVSHGRSWNLESLKEYEP